MAPNAQINKAAVTLRIAERQVSATAHSAVKVWLVVVMYLLRLPRVMKLLYQRVTRTSNSYGIGFIQ
jgi:hypothetical protein